MTSPQAPPPSLIAAIPDIMASVRVSEAARAAGIPLRLVEGDDWQAALLTLPRPPGAVVDLTAAGAIDRIAAAVAAEVPVLAYGPHVDAGLLAAASAAGAAQVVPRGRMMQQAAALLAELHAGTHATPLPPSRTSPTSRRPTEDDDAPSA